MPMQGDQAEGVEVNRILRHFGWMLVPAPPSAKMLHEHANVSECHHPSRGGNTVRWMRKVAEMMPS
jgi:hypothetical protein